MEFPTSPSWNQIQFLLPDKGQKHWPLASHCCEAHSDPEPTTIFRSEST
jgi:hypothetical protein